MDGVDQVDAFVIKRAAIVAVHAVKDNIFRCRSWLYAIENTCQWYALPFADHAPPFDAVVPGNLGARRHRLQLDQRESAGLLHQSADFKPPFRPLIARVRGIIHGDRWWIAVAAKFGRD